MNVFQCHINNMTLENYATLYNETIYKSEGPYKLRTGLRTEGNKFSLIVQIGIKKVIEEPFIITNSSKEYVYQDILILYGDTEKEILKMFESIDLHKDHKEYFKSLWNK